jgi:Zn-dependent protease
VSELLLGAPSVCPGCGSEVAGGLLSCPGCDRLVHAAELGRLADQAEEATAAGDAARALALWHRVLELLPPEAGQRAAIGERIEALAGARSAPAPRGTGTAKKTGLAGIVGAFLLKAKTILVFVLGKAKLLIFGLGKLSTLVSMGPYLALTWQRYGFGLAAGVMLSIYVHEMGHVSALRFFGLPAGAPVFIPGFGALIRLRMSPPSERIDARIGLAGPVWGLGAAVVAYGVYLASGVHLWAAVARVGAVINLFNLTPVWQLDGGRAFNSFSRRQRIWAAGALVLAFAATRNHWLFLPLGGAAWQLFRPAPDRDDAGAFGTYVLLAFVLAAFELLPGMRL